MMKFMFPFLISIAVSASGIVDLGNLDIKGKLNLPAFKLNSSELNLDAGLLKISKMEYKENASIESMIYPSHSNLKKKIALQDEDFKFDLVITKERLD